jgi:hypothetical protein
MPNQTITGNLAVTGNIGADGFISANGGLLLGGGVEAAEDVKTKGDLEATGNLNVTGAATVQGQLQAQTVVIQSGLRAQGAILSGDATINGQLFVVKDIILSGQDCAEEFVVCPDSDASAGTVMVVAPDGELRESSSAYDNGVAGVVSGAEPHRPGMIMGRTGDPGRHLPIALAGRVSCKVEATSGPIVPGDLLTTSDIPGHAMKASDRVRAAGAIVGKALRPLESGTGMVPILVALA